MVRKENREPNQFQVEVLRKVTVTDKIDCIISVKGSAYSDLMGNSFGDDYSLA